ncbi:MAG: S1 RNA-binding domain-containing protein [Deltaproteobacteria bacterium]|jgi:small subunit ribosomal protein S1|nr:S1 RNA-binding domain-containing protein [Deltaproteobacteria bacterium]
MAENTPDNEQATTAAPGAPETEMPSALETVAPGVPETETPASLPSAAPVSPREAEDENFAELFAAENVPGALLTPGRRVTVTVVALTSDTVFVSTGSKVDGIVERSELEEDMGSAPQVGDQLDLYVVAVTSQEVRLSKMIRGAGGFAALEEAKDARLPVEGKVQAIVKGGFAVEVMKRRAFCPLGQMDLRPVENPESFIGRTLPFLITKLEKNGRDIVLSRRLILEAEQAENREAFLAGVAVGDVLEGKVVRLAPFGVFVELATGVEGLIHLSELAWGRVVQADEAVAAGDALRVKILEIAAGEKGPRISLSARQVTDDPWKSLDGRLEEGQIVTGKVVRNAAFGSFVEVLPGIDGLIHISELSYEKRVNKPDDVLTVGETVNVKIKGIDFAKKRLSLSLRDAGIDPWEGVDEDFPLGAVVTGVLEKRAPFGMFITLRPGVTGLLPASTLAASRGKSPVEKAAAGGEVQVVVREVDMKARKVTLGLPSVEKSGEREEERDWKKHAPKPAPQAGFGNTLGSLMQAAALSKRK